MLYTLYLYTYTCIHSSILYYIIYLHHILYTLQILRGCTVRNTDWVLGLVVNTGQYTDIIIIIIIIIILSFILALYIPSIQLFNYQYYTNNYNIYIFYTCTLYKS